MAAAASTPLCTDAVIVLPGIMGSELVDIETGTVLWGLSARRYVSLWSDDSPWEKLMVTQSERDGNTGRIRATRLLRNPAFAPVLQGAEPYARLVTGIRAVMIHPQAVLEFPYDWRLSIAHNAAELSDAAQRHLRTWRAHPHGRTDAKLILVAHSMGGLIARYFTGLLGGSAEVRQTIAIGTPFHGAVKAVFLLDRGRGSYVPLPRRRLRALASTMPGVHDLLPSYRCVAEHESSRRLSPADVEGLGGSLDLARASAQMHDDLAMLGPADLRTVVGVEQPTMQSLRLRDGVAVPQFFMHEDDGHVDWRGDGTVYSEVATGGIEPVSSLPQSHGGLARAPEALVAIRAILTRRRLGPPMGAAVIGLDVPDSVNAGESFEISVTSGDAPGGARCRIVDADTNLQVSRPFLVHRDAAMVASAKLPLPGLYRVEAQDGGFSAVTQLVLALPVTRPGV